MKQLYGSKSVDQGGALSTSDLNGVYTQLYGQTDQANTYALQEHSNDEMMGPTRGTDWGDFGTWRKLHTHTWTPSHNQVNDTWDQLNIGVFRATQVIVRASTEHSKGRSKLFTRLLYVPDS
jgi:S-adenosylmethionine:diacylglycerol 3-amino-3-carboxypropyl transferase